MKPIKERNPAVVGVIGIVVVLVIGVLAYYSDDLPVIGGGTTYSAEFTEAAGLHDGDGVRVAGVKVGEVSGVGLDGDHVKVDFRVKDAWVGGASTAAIKIKTLLGSKYLSVDPLGTKKQDPGTMIPASRTSSPYDVTEAFTGLGHTISNIDTGQLAKSFEAVSDAFSDTPPQVHSALQGLSSLSKTISSRDTQLAKLLKNTNRITGTLSGQKGHFQQLINDGNLLLGELRKRRDAISAMLSGTRHLATEMSGLVSDNEKQIGPALDALDKVTDVLENHKNDLNHALALAGPYYRQINNALGNGRWFDTYLCCLVPDNYLPAGSGPGHGCVSPRVGGGH